MAYLGPVAIALLLEFTPSYCRGYASGLVWVGYYLGEVLEVPPPLLWRELLQCIVRSAWPG